MREGRSLEEGPPLVSLNPHKEGLAMHVLIIANIVWLIDILIYLLEILKVLLG